MVAAISATSQLLASGPVRGTTPAQPARFSIPESPLRENEHTPGARASDSVLADTVALSGYPALGASQQTYSPPPTFGFGNNSNAQEYSGISSSEDDDNELVAQSPTEEEESATASGEMEETDKEEEAEPGQKTDAKGEPLSEEESKQLDKLQSRDREVRQHEQAHKSTGGSLAGSISYEYQRGPDGKNYAVGGEVSIDVSKESDPSATISKMRRVRAAALAPADPSGQDRQVAAQATTQEAEARKELSQQRMEETEGDSEKDGESDSGNKGNGNAVAGPNAPRQGGPSVGTLSGAASTNQVGRLAASSFAAAPAALTTANSLNRQRAMIDVFA